MQAIEATGSDGQSLEDQADMRTSSFCGRPGRAALHRPRKDALKPPDVRYIVDSTDAAQPSAVLQSPDTTTSDALEGAQLASPRRKSLRDMPRGSMLGMSWSMEGARLKPLLKPLGMSYSGPKDSDTSGSAVEALCMNAERRPWPQLGADWRPATQHHVKQASPTS